MAKQDKTSYVKTEITKTLLNLLKKQRLEDIDIIYLCNEAKVGRASFYRNYASKEQVILEHASKLIQKWGNEFEANPNSSPFNVFESLFNHYYQNKSFYTLLYKNNMSFIMLDIIKKHIGLVDDISNSEAYGKAFLAYGIFGWVNEWISRGMKEKPEEINKMFIESSNLNKA